MEDKEKQIRKEICDRWAALGFTEESWAETRKKLTELLEEREESGEVQFPIVRNIHFEKEVDKYIKEHLDELCDGLKIK